jgi:hypothetical protein
LYNFTFSKNFKKPFLIKLFNWEYWSFNAVYGPIYIVYLLLCLKPRNLFFFNATNPSIAYGGFLMERKSDIYKIIPQSYYPPTWLITLPKTANLLGTQLQKMGLHFPMIIKPDIGGKGRGVKKVHTIDEAFDYIQKNSTFPMLAQNLIPYANEVGLFYYKLPNQKTGVISGIVAKEFLQVIGNGINTIEELLGQQQRGILQIAALKTTNQINLNEILPNNQTKVLVPFGNHARGAKFLNWSHKITPQLTSSFNKICGNIPGFYYGRLDVMYQTWEELERGENFAIVELNGAGSEPTHIYDPKHSIFYAWKEIIKHWWIMLQIAEQNKKQNNGNYLSWKEGINMFKQNATIEKKLDVMLND